MSVIKLLHKIYYNPDICIKIIYYYERVMKDYEKMPIDVYNKLCAKHHLDMYPSMLFNFFDSVGIKIAISPVGNSEFWSSKIYHNQSITVSNDYVSRDEATLGALNKAVEIYKLNIKIE